MPFVIAGVERHNRDISMQRSLMLAVFVSPKSAMDQAVSVKKKGVRTARTKGAFHANPIPQRVQQTKVHPNLHQNPRDPINLGSIRFCTI
jgi:hypothetical protein